MRNIEYQATAMRFVDIINVMHIVIGHAKSPDIVNESEVVSYSSNLHLDSIFRGHRYDFAALDNYRYCYLQKIIMNICHNCDPNKVPW